MESLWTFRPKWSLMASMVWLSVHIRLMNQNAFPPLSGNVLAALPIRAIRESNEWQPQRFINPLTRGCRSLASHTV
jgi:hypothetical protein